MKAILEFDYDKDQDEENFLVHAQSFKMYWSLYAIKEKIRRLIKDSEDDTKTKTLIELSEHIDCILEENSVDLDILR